MKEVGLRTVHIGQEIKRRLEEVKMTKTEFGRLIDTPQQHVNRIFNRENIDTGKLLKICRALDYNFFALYCYYPTNISAHLSTVSMSGSANNVIGEAAVIGEMEVMKVRLEDAKRTESDLRDQIQGLKDNVEQMKSQLRDKDEIINLYKNK